MNSIDQDIIEASEDLTERLGEILGDSLNMTSDRVRVSALVCSIALEHGVACRMLLANGFVRPVFRLVFEIRL